MKQTTLLVILFLFTLTVNAQENQKIDVNEYASIDKIALQMPNSSTKTTDGIAQYIDANFKTDKEKIRAIFIWIATNIQYDVALLSIKNFHETNEEKITRPLNTGKGVCENYAALFTDVCKKSGIKSFVIDGYTKQSGIIVYSTGHSWCTALIDNSWLLFDPTWGSGYLNGGKFYKRINNDYYNTNPYALMKTHMPYDCLWQLVNYPINNHEFFDDKILEDKSKPYFNYADSIESYAKLTSTEQFIASARRIEENGFMNSLISERMQYIKAEIEYGKKKVDYSNQKEFVNLFKVAVLDYNEGINNFKMFIQYRNKKLSPTKSDQEIQSMLEVIVTKFTDAKAKLNEIKNPGVSNGALIIQLTKSIEFESIHLKEQQDWLHTYLNKRKAGASIHVLEPQSYRVRSSFI